MPDDAPLYRLDADGRIALVECETCDRLRIAIERARAHIAFGRLAAAEDTLSVACGEGTADPLAGEQRLRGALLAIGSGHPDPVACAQQALRDTTPLPLKEARDDG